MPEHSSTEENDVLTWDQFPVNKVFILDGVFYLKLGATDIVQVRPTPEGHCIGCGTTFHYDPTWKLTFSKAGVASSAEALRRNMHSDHAREGVPLSLLLCAAGLIIVGIIILMVWHFWNWK